MDINEAAFQKSRTCLADARAWPGGKSALEWKRFREDLRCVPQDCVVYVWAPAGCHNTNHPTTDAKRSDEKQVGFFKGLNVLYQYEGAMDKIQVQMILIYKCSTLCKANSPVGTPTI